MSPTPRMKCQEEMPFRKMSYILKHKELNSGNTMVVTCKSGHNIWVHLDPGSKTFRLPNSKNQPPKIKMVRFSFGFIQE